MFCPKSSPSHVNSWAKRAGTLGMLSSLGNMFGLIGTFSSFNNIIYFFQYIYLFIYLGCGAPDKRVGEWGLFKKNNLVGL
jgi:hypothetical protein